MCVGDACLSMFTPGKRKFFLTTVGIEPASLVCQSNALPTELRGQVGSSV